MAFAIFSAVDYWNMWFPVLIFIRNKSDVDAAVHAARHLHESPASEAGSSTPWSRTRRSSLPQNIINAAIICTVVPIIIIYPFLQRYFIHGVIVGAVKG